MIVIFPFKDATVIHKDLSQINVRRFLVNVDAGLVAKVEFATVVPTGIFVTQTVNVSVILLYMY